MLRRRSRGAAATVYLQLSAELRCNVDLHVAAAVVKQVLVHTRLAHRTRKECVLVESGAEGPRGSNWRPNSSGGRMAGGGARRAGWSGSVP